MAYNDAPGISGLHDAFKCIKDHQEEGLTWTSKVYKESMYIKNKIVLELNVKWKDKVTEADITRLFRSKQKIEEDDNYLPLEKDAVVDNPEDIYLFASLSDDSAEEISPEDNEAMLSLFEEVCQRTSKKFTAYIDKGTGISYVCRLTEAEAAANDTPYLPFDFISKREELKGMLDKHTIFPPEELADAEGVLQRIREINQARVAITDIDFTGEDYITVTAEGDYSFCCKMDLIPNLALSDIEKGIPGYYLLAMFTETAKKLKKKDEIPAVEYRECIYLLTESTNNSSEPDTTKKTKGKKKNTTTTNSATTKEVVPASTQTSFPGLYTGQSSASSAGTGARSSTLQGSANAGAQTRVPADADYDSLDDCYRACGY